jgi:hypothetical protein
MFKLYTDKDNTFKCKVLVEGADESSSIARLIIEGENYNLMFEGTLKNGTCEVNIGKFKNFDNFKSKGQVKLEVIADDTHFIPWSSEYILEQTKNIVVEVVENKPVSKPLVEVSEIVTTKVSNPHGDKIYKILKENVDLNKYSSFTNLVTKNTKAQQVVKKYVVENKISGDKLKSVLDYLTEKF